jgi:hypothetical protein
MQSSTQLDEQVIAAHSFTVRAVATTAYEVRDGKVWIAKCAGVLRTAAGVETEKRAVN